MQIKQKKSEASGNFRY